MAHPAGLEPATFSVETDGSIQLSYECIKMVVPIGFDPTTFVLSTHCSKPTELRDN